MKNSTDGGFDQHYNAQVAVAQESLLIGVCTIWPVSAQRLTLRIGCLCTAHAVAGLVLSGEPLCLGGAEPWPRPNECKCQGIIFRTKGGWWRSWCSAGRRAPPALLHGNSSPQ